MRSIRLHGPRDMRMHDEPVPVPGVGDVLIEIKSVGVCASDAHWYKHGNIGDLRIKDPLVLGHEASGVIAALGEGVENVKVGDRVAIEPAKPCMQCEWCKSGHYNVCPGIPFFGTTPTDGAFRDFIAWPANLVIPIPDSLSFDEAAMVEPLAVGIYAAELADISPNDTIAIFGAGAIGLSVLQAAKLAGVGRVIVSDPIEARRNLAKKLGADEVIDTLTCDEINRLTSGRGADIVFECSGEPDALYETAKSTRVLGKIIVVGIPDEDNYCFEASASRRKQLSVIFVRRSNCAVEKSIEEVASGHIDVKSYATHRFALENLEEAMRIAMEKSDGVIRAVIAVSN